MSSRSTIAILLPAITLVFGGCATKDWVQQVIGKERGETNAKVAGIEQRVGDESQRITGLDERLGGETKRADAFGVKLKTVEESTEATRGLATSARERADGAFARADEVDGRLTRLWTSRHKRSVVDTTQVHFAFDRWELDDRAQTALLDVVAELKKNPALAVALEGYTDKQGPAAYNLELSRRRVEAVRRYLVGRGVELWRINSIGLGQLEATNVPEPQKRKVSITLTVAE
jgi:outer membrane protein OmpA-like peptidoglycan-associated protein